MSEPAEAPMAVLLSPVVLFWSADVPMPTLNSLCRYFRAHLHPLHYYWSRSYKTKRPPTHSCVLAACGVAIERFKTDGCVAETGGVAVERAKTVSRVVAPSGVAKECECSAGRVLKPRAIAQERPQPQSQCCHLPY